MKKLFSIVIILMFVLSFSGCSNSKTGTYYHEKNNSNFLELKSNNEFILQENDIGFHGEYEIDGSVITLKTALGYAINGTIEKDVIIDPDGEKWIKH